ncbi:MAG: succinylglutamate desuccinylase/aspartoacylase family protein [Pseudomonadales bacterium]
MAIFAALTASLWLGFSYDEPPAPEREPLPVELRETAHLEPALFAVELADPEWAEVEPPTAPEMNFSVIVAAPEVEPLPTPAVAATETEAPRHYAKVATLDIKALEMESFSQLSWATGETLHGAPVSTPVLVAKGKEPGTTLCVTAAVHGDELNGIEAVRNLMYSVNVHKLKGTIIGVPIVNLQGFQRNSRYLADRRDLNRYFPGHPRGSVAARMAYGFFENVIRQCDGLVDLHTGSFHRTNLPQLRANLHNEDVLELTKGFGATTILHSLGGEGTLRRAAVDAGIPAVTLEAGEPLRLQEDAVEHAVKALFTLLDTLGMYNKRSLWGNPEPTYYQSAWVRADQGGMLFSKIKLGKRVAQGDVLGNVTDPITNEQVAIVAPYSGRVIGMAVNQFVMPGYATYHLAAETDLENPQETPIDHTGDMEVALTPMDAMLEESE